MNAPDPSLLNIFAAEQSEHVAHMRALLRELLTAEAERRRVVVEQLMRRAHTLKGAARAVGVEATEQIVHRIEGILAHQLVSAQGLSDSTADLINRALDTIEDVLAGAQGRRAEPDHTSVLHDLEREGAKVSDNSAAMRPQTPPDAEPASVSVTAGELLRVPAATLDGIVRVSAELVTSTAQGAGVAEQLLEHSREMDEAHREYTQLRRACSALLSNAASESARLVECLRFVDSRWDAFRLRVRRAAAAQQQSSWRIRRQVDELHELASQARMIPAETIFGPFGAMVRALGSEERKLVTFRSEGLDLAADRLVLQSLKDPVMHLLRNAVSHGIESPAVRTAAGKPESGLIQLIARSRGDRLTVIVEDDGAGVDKAAVADQAVRLGYAPPEIDARSTQVDQLLFRPGFSTSKTVSEMSGRGVGLSVVKEAVLRLQGEVWIHPRTAGGTQVTISVPLAISTQHVLMVEAGHQTFAIPTAFVESVQRRTRGDVVIVDGRPSIVCDSEPLPLVHLADLLRIDSGGKSEVRSLFVVIISTAGMRVATAVDAIIEDREVIVRETGLEPALAGFSAGAIPLDDGGAAVLLNFTEVLQEFQRSGHATAFATPQPEPRRSRILVVDDSITTRSVERNILESHGYEVDLAVDGLDALDKVRSARPDLIISDVAMPRLDGFQLLERLKSEKDTSSIPVILVTSLEKPEEQERGLSLGADAYIVKRKFDQRELLATVRQIL